MTGRPDLELFYGLSTRNNTFGGTLKASLTETSCLCRASGNACITRGLKRQGSLFRERLVRGNEIRTGAGRN